MKTLRLTMAEEPWFMWLDHPFDREFMDWYKQFPGRQWVKSEKKWKFPIELTSHLVEGAVQHGYQVIDDRGLRDLWEGEVLGDKLFDYQRQNVQAALRAGGRWIFANDTGVGKTAEAIAGLRRLSVDRDTRILVVCPALVRKHWVDEFDKWWPDHPEIGVIEYGRGRQLSKPKRLRLESAHAADIIICSYNLAGEVDASMHFTAVVLDESHKLSNKDTKWSKHLKALLTGQPSSTAIFGLTATAVPNRAHQLWNQLDTVWPGRFGTGYQFLARYLEQEHNGYGTVWKGLRDDTGDELADRLSTISSRTTKKEIAHLLPPFYVSTLRVSGSAGSSSPVSKHEAVAALLKAGHTKVDPTIEWVGDMHAAGEQWLCVLTHHRELGKKLHQLIKAKYGRRYAVEYVDGESPVTHRLEKIDRLKQFSSGILVATMESIGIGIDLTKFSQALFSELHYRPEVMIQALGRFSRLSGKVPSQCTLMIVEGTIDELIASSLEDKINDINVLVKPGLAEGKLADALTEDPQVMLDKIRKLADNYEEQDPLLFWDDED